MPQPFDTGPHGTVWIPGYGWMTERQFNQMAQSQSTNPSNQYPPDIPPATGFDPNAQWQPQSPTPTPTPLGSPSPSPTFTPTSTATATSTPTATATFTPTPTPSATFTPTPTSTPTDTPTPSPTFTPTPTSTPTSAPAPTPGMPDYMYHFASMGSPSPTPTPTETPASTPPASGIDTAQNIATNFVPNPEGGYWGYDQNWNWVGGYPDYSGATPTPAPESTSGAAYNPTPNEAMNAPFQDSYIQSFSNPVPADSAANSVAAPNDAFFPADQPPDLSNIPANVAPGEAGASATDQYGAPTDTYLPPDQEPSTIATGAYPPPDDQSNQESDAISPPDTSWTQNPPGAGPIAPTYVSLFDQPSGQNIGAGPLSGSFAGLGSFGPGSVAGVDPGVYGFGGNPGLLAYVRSLGYQNIGQWVVANSTGSPTASSQAQTGGGGGQTPAAMGGVQ